MFIIMSSCPEGGGHVDHESFDGLGVLLSGVWGIRVHDGSINETNTPEPLCGPIMSMAPGPHSCGAPLWGTSTLTQFPP